MNSLSASLRVLKYCGRQAVESLGNSYPKGYASKAALYDLERIRATERTSCILYQSTRA